MRICAPFGFDEVLVVATCILYFSVEGYPQRLPRKFLKGVSSTCNGKVNVR